MSDSGLEARVLVCDPERIIFPKIVELMHAQFGAGEPPGPEIIQRARALGNFQMGNVEFNFIDDITQVKKEVRTRTGRDDPPYYSLVVYESTQVNKNGIADVIAGIRNHDFFLPQMVVGKGLDSDAIGHCARAGALYFGETTAKVEDQIKKIFRKPAKLPNLTVVKIGGSAFKFEDQNLESFNLEYVCDELVKIHQERGNTRKDRKVNRMIATVGAGQYGKTTKRWLIKYSHHPKVREMHPQQMADNLKSNINLIKTLFDQTAKVITTGAFYYIGRDSTSKRILFIGTAPHYLMQKYQLPLQDSDTHTLVVAESYAAERVIIIKRADGIYDYDPYRGYPLGMELPKSKFIKKLIEYNWRWHQRHNKRHEVVTAQELLMGNISREGTGMHGKADGSSEHLMEDSSLRYLQTCKNVKEVVIVHIAPEEIHYQIGSNRYRHIVTGEEITVNPKTGWKGILEDNIRNAFNGIANSKIVRG